MQVDLVARGVTELDFSSHDDATATDKERAAVQVIETIDASSNEISRILNLNIFASLTTLILRKNALTSPIMLWVRELPLTLRILDVSHNEITSLLTTSSSASSSATPQQQAPFTMLTNLLELDISNNLLDTSTLPSNMPVESLFPQSLLRLNVSNNSSIGALNGLTTGLISLQELDATNNKVFSLAGIEAVALNCPHLESLNVLGNPLVPAIGGNYSFHLSQMFSMLKFVDGERIREDDGCRSEHGDDEESRTLHAQQEKDRKVTQQPSVNKIPPVTRARVAVLPRTQRNSSATAVAEEVVREQPVSVRYNGLDNTQSFVEEDADDVPLDTRCSDENEEGCSARREHDELKALLQQQRCEPDCAPQDPKLKSSQERQHAMEALLANAIVTDDEDDESEGYGLDTTNDTMATTTTDENGHDVEYDDEADEYGDGYYNEAPLPPTGTTMNLTMGSREERLNYLYRHAKQLEVLLQETAAANRAQREENTSLERKVRERRRLVGAQVKEISAAKQQFDALCLDVQRLEHKAKKREFDLSHAKVAADRSSVMSTAAASSRRSRSRSAAGGRSTYSDDAAGGSASYLKSTASTIGGYMGVAVNNTISQPGGVGEKKNVANRASSSAHRRPIDLQAGTKYENVVRLTNGAIKRNTAIKSKLSKRKETMSPIGSGEVERFRYHEDPMIAPTNGASQQGERRRNPQPQSTSQGYRQGNIYTDPDMLSRTLLAARHTNNQKNATSAAPPAAGIQDPHDTSRYSAVAWNDAVDGADDNNNSDDDELEQLRRQVPDDAQQPPPPRVVDEDSSVSSVEYDDYLSPGAHRRMNNAGGASPTPLKATPRAEQGQHIYEQRTSRSPQRKDESGPSHLLHQRHRTSPSPSSPPQRRGPSHDEQEEFNAREGSSQQRHRSVSGGSQSGQEGPNAMVTRRHEEYLKTEHDMRLQPPNTNNQRDARMDAAAAHLSMEYRRHHQPQSHPYNSSLTVAGGVTTGMSSFTASTMKTTAVPHLLGDSDGIGGECTTTAVGVAGGPASTMYSRNGGDDVVAAATSTSRLSQSMMNEHIPHHHQGLVGSMKVSSTSHNVSMASVHSSVSDGAGLPSSIDGLDGGGRVKDGGVMIADVPISVAKPLLR